ncbi:MAG: cyclopropane-fatty-acyl-phospholipid synthase family protein [Andreesenia angusta]|nr:cyclopropane-fatty-acyl-phospholipid synthase family protein [Andreesenia angusta]
MGVKTKVYTELFKNSFSIPMKIEYWNGEIVKLGDGEIEAFIKINEPLDWKKVSEDASIALAEAYMDKKIEINGPLKELIVSAYGNKESFLESKKFRLLKIVQKHDKKKSSEDIQYHYDIGNDFYEHWLDNSMTYSCAYFKSENDSLEKAQEQKIEHILNKLRLKPTDHLLDIGCGWGNLIITAAQKYGVKATGCTLSKEQYNLVNKKIERANLKDLVAVELLDYRDAAKGKVKYDKIASVGMFEHVGKENIPEYISCIKKLLKDRGLALIHGISGQRDFYDDSLGTNGFLNKYIFPGGYIPSLAELMIPINQENMSLIDLESLRRHYQLTLDEWYRRFKENWDVILADKGERFMRMWEVYLQGCAAIFESGNLDVCQYLIEKGTDNTRPLTRKYME